MVIKYSPLIKSPYFYLFLLAIVSLLVALFFVRYPLQLNGDAPSYLNAMRFLQGQAYEPGYLNAETAMMVKARILTTPLMLLSSVVVSKVVGSEYGGMLFINIIFSFLIIFVFYQLIYTIYKSRYVAFWGTVLFFTNYCFYNYGVTYRTDIGGWFFFLLSALLAVKYFFQPESEKYYYLSIFTSSIGVLFKENGALGLIALGILILFLPARFTYKIKNILFASLLFLIIPFSYHLFIYWQFHFSYFDWYNLATSVTIKSANTAINWSPLLLAKVLGWLFSVGWLIFLWGLYQEYKNFDKQRVRILLAILVPSLSFLAWPGLTQRIAFILVPWLAMISGFGLAKIKSRYLVWLIVLGYVLINYWIRNLTVPDLLHLINF